MDALIDRLCIALGVSAGPYRALLRTGYHTNYFIVVMGALMDPVYDVRFAAQLVGKLAALYVSFNLLLYGGIYTVNAIVDVEEDRRLKPWRPLATGAITVGRARLLAILLLSTGFASGWLLGPVPAIPRIFAAFVGVNAVYSFCVRPLASQTAASHFAALTAPLRLALGAALVGGGAPSAAALLAAWASMAAVHVSRKRIERGERPALHEHALTSAAMFSALFLGPRGAFGLGWGVPYGAFVLFQHVGFGVLPCVNDDSFAKLRAFYKKTTQ